MHKQSNRRRTKGPCPIDPIATRCWSFENASGISLSWADAFWRRPDDHYLFAGRPSRIVARPILVEILLLNDLRHLKLPASHQPTHRRRIRMNRLQRHQA